MRSHACRAAALWALLMAPCASVYYDDFYKGSNVTIPDDYSAPVSNSLADGQQCSAAEAMVASTFTKDCTRVLPNGVRMHYLEKQDPPCLRTEVVEYVDYVVSNTFEKGSKLAAGLTVCVTHPLSWLMVHKHKARQGSSPDGSARLYVDNEPWPQTYVQSDVVITDFTDKVSKTQSGGVHFGEGPGHVTPPLWTACGSTSFFARRTHNPLDMLDKPAMPAKSEFCMFMAFNRNLYRKHVGEKPYLVKVWLAAHPLHTRCDARCDARMRTVSRMRVPPRHRLSRSESRVSCHNACGYVPSVCVCLYLSYLSHLGHRGTWRVRSCTTSSTG